MDHNSSPNQPMVKIF